jgi:hypothetical protein
VHRLVERRPVLVPPAASPVRAVVVAAVAVATTVASPSAATTVSSPTIPAESWPGIVQRTS